MHLRSDLSCFLLRLAIFNDYSNSSRFFRLPRLYSKKCFKCKDGFNKNDFVMRAGHRIYHIDCFRCCMCSKQLAPGDEFALKEDGLLCKSDNEIFEKHASSSATSLSSSSSASSANTPSSNSNPTPIIASTSGPNGASTTPLGTQNTNINNINNNNQTHSGPNPNKLIKSEESSNSLPLANDYEDNQNCLSPSNYALGNHMMSVSGPPPPPPTSAHMHLNHARMPPHQLQAAHHLGLAPRSLPGPGSSSSSISSNSSNSSNSSMSSESGAGLMMGAASSIDGPVAPSSTVMHHHSHSHSHGHGGHGGHGSGHHRKDKTTRVRTVLNEKQLHTLRTCYGANPRPDALMKEQLVEMTGLSPRVIRVWFQNKRCKDKKKTILIKQMQEQQKVNFLTLYSLL